MPAIPIRDLPPFPEVEADSETVSEVGVYGASLADEETVVGAAKREQSLGTVASAVTVITADTIRRFGYRSLAEALRSVTGVYITDDRMVERIGVRGVQLLGDANTRILILIDGTPLNEPWSQFVDSSTALPVSLDDVARIEVIRGPVSSIYGTNAFVGIINVVTIEADKAPAVYGRTSTDTYGTVGGNAAFNSGDLNRQVRGSVGYSYRNGETVTYPDFSGTMATSADGSQAVYGSIAVNYDRVFAQVRAYDRIRELPGAPFNADFGSTENINDDQHILGEVGYTRAVSDAVTLSGRLYANRYHFKNHLSYSGADFETNATSLWYGGELRALADVLKKDNRNLLSLTTGASVELTQTSSTATTAPDPLEHSFNIAGVYLEGTSELTKWFALTAGGRFDRNSEFSNRVSPRAAAFLRKGESYGAKFLYAQGFRNPSIFEAYYDDQSRFHPSLTDGQSDLESETITAYEVVAYGRPLPGVKLRVSAWEWYMTQLFKRDPVTVDPPAPSPQLEFKNTGPLVSRGVEVESSYRDVAGRVAYLNASFAFTGKNCFNGYKLYSNTFLDVDAGSCDPKVNSPVVTAKVGASSQLLLKSFHLSTELSFISARGTQDPDQEVPAYLGWNVVWYVPSFRGFDITVGARNLLGRERVPAQSDYNRGSGAGTIEVLEVPGPGREVFARVGYRF